jgi:hypothetical protein
VKAGRQDGLIAKAEAGQLHNSHQSMMNIAASLIFPP